MQTVFLKRAKKSASRLTSVLSSRSPSINSGRTAVEGSSGSQGFTLIEVMVVVVILGILAAIIVPRIMGRPEEAKRTKAQVDIKAVEEALNLYRLDNGSYPTTEQGIEALVKKPEIAPIPPKWREGGYLSKVPVDPWGRNYQYLSPGEHGDFDLVSLGADGEPGGEGKNADVESWNL